MQLSMDSLRRSLVKGMLLHTQMHAKKAIGNAFFVYGHFFYEKHYLFEKVFASIGVEETILTWTRLEHSFENMAAPPESE